MTVHKTGRIGRQNYNRLNQMIADGMSAIAIADVLEVFPETVRKYARRRGLTIQPQDMTMEKHPCWRGGTTVDRSGYILQRVEVDGPYGYLIRALRLGDTRGYAPVHRIVMHDKLGRKLRPDEVVHHIDDDVKNNSPENLTTYQTNAEHLADTLKGKVPNWTPEGWNRICSPKRRQRANP